MASQTRTELEMVAKLASRTAGSLNLLLERGSLRPRDAVSYALTLRQAAEMLDRVAERLGGKKSGN